MEKYITDDISDAPSKSSSADLLDGFIPETEFARQRGVTRRTCQRDRQLRKAPPYIRLGRQIYYRLDAVRDWLVKNECIDELTPDLRKFRGGRSSRQWSGRQS